MKLPSIEKLAEVFEDPGKARAILAMTRGQLEKTEAGASRVAECYHAPDDDDLRLHCLNALERGLHGPEAMVSSKGEIADYLNAGDSYAATVIYWRGRYRVQSIGDFVEVMERQKVTFK